MEDISSDITSSNSSVFIAATYSMAAALMTNVSDVTASLMVASTSTTGTARGGQLMCPGESCIDNTFCFNDGVCCITDQTGGLRKFCRCPEGFIGERCKDKDQPIDYLDYLASHDTRIVKASITSVMTLIIGLLALVASVILIAIFTRRRWRMRRSARSSIDYHLSELQEDLDHMPTISKLIHLTRLTKIFEQSTRSAVQTTVLSPDVHQSTPSVTARDACLPRWSSSPASLAFSVRAADVPDSAAAASPLLDPKSRRQLKQVFSFDIGLLHRPDARDHHHHQQQHASTNQDAAVITRL